MIYYLGIIEKNFEVCLAIDPTAFSFYYNIIKAQLEYTRIRAALWRICVNFLRHACGGYTPSKVLLACLLASICPQSDAICHRNLIIVVFSMGPTSPCVLWARQFECITSHDEAHGLRNAYHCSRAFHGQNKQLNNREVSKNYEMQSPRLCFGLRLLVWAQGSFHKL